jgi:hypothetical protein
MIKFPCASPVKETTPRGNALAVVECAWEVTAHWPRNLQMDVKWLACPLAIGPKSI